MATIRESKNSAAETPPHSLAENRDTFPAIHGQSGHGCSFLQTGKDLAKENEKHSLRFGPASSRRRPSGSAISVLRPGHHPLHPSGICATTVVHETPRSNTK
ncbi:unnamed protein product [Pleuronectes platessa]|uniref:Uncharacterized protein n=1 Tax=Pleuronectes platessa TaxID=8262 RepID=A0A9N7ZDH7_PLEPL|nr:unnamed protein product [Pleuronectes platessa]